MATPIPDPSQIDYSHIYYVFGVHPQEDGTIQRHLLGKFILTNDGLHILENHGLRDDIESLSPREVTRYIYSLSKGQRTEVVNAEDIAQGHYPHLLPTADEKGSIPNDIRDAINRQFKEKEAKQAATFHYHREGMPIPQRLELHGETGSLDGHPLSHEELQQIIGNARSGKASLRREQKLAKGIPEHLVPALGAIRSAAKKGHIDPEHLKTITRQMFSDTMVPTIGNRLSYSDFSSRPRQGAYVSWDGNSFGHINKVHGFEAGDEAIKLFFNAARTAMDKSVGRAKGKMWRIGGDEGKAFVPTPAHAAAFARAFRAELDAIPHFRGTHKLSVSLGFGNNNDEAEHAVRQAKFSKKAENKEPGLESTHIATYNPQAPAVDPEGVAKVKAKPPVAQGSMVKEELDPEVREDKID